jgi:hypothetical protein
MSAAPMDMQTFFIMLLLLMGFNMHFIGLA